MHACVSAVGSISASALLTVAGIRQRPLCNSNIASLAPKQRTTGRVASLEVSKNDHQHVRNRGKIVEMSQRLVRLQGSKSVLDSEAIDKSPRINAYSYNHNSTSVSSQLRAILDSNDVDGLERVKACKQRCETTMAIAVQEHGTEVTLRANGLGFRTNVYSKTSLPSHKPIVAT